jgi:acetoin utilization deacetylase AcuC-like enzyme
MRKVGFITHPDCARHSQWGHPESPERTAAIEKHFRESGLRDRLAPLPAEKATLEDVAVTHDPAYVEFVVDRIRSGLRSLDPDTYITEHSLDAALLSFGGGLLAVDRVCRGELDRAFCCLRPPGHHCNGIRPKGFCIFNNIAGAAQHALDRHGRRRVSIIDFDGHHGNGTQEIFYQTDAVHYTSVHQYPFYPGSGRSDEIGKGPGKGYTLNLPLRAGTEGRVAIRLLEEHYLPAMETYQPDLVLVSAGFDGHSGDPLVMLRFDHQDYYSITEMITKVADRYADGKVVSFLEGGYNLGDLVRSAYLHVRALFDD